MVGLWPRARRVRAACSPARIARMHRCLQAKCCHCTARPAKTSTFTAKNATRDAWQEAEPDETMSVQAWVRAKLELSHCDRGSQRYEKRNQSHGN